MDLFTVIWLILGLVALGVELYGAVAENDAAGVEPLTRILRDRLMRQHPLVKLLVFMAWAWLGGHFFLGLP